MMLAKEICFKFPAVLRAKLLNGEIELPDETKIGYEKFLTYRAVEREADDFRVVAREDFQSYFELGKRPKKGYVYQEGGPEHTNDQHVCWWLYEGADVSGFRIVEE